MRTAFLAVVSFVGALPLMAAVPTQVNFVSSVNSNNNVVVYGQPVTLSATIFYIVEGQLPFPTQPTLTGTVTFMDGTATLGAAPVSNNSAQLTIAAPSPGSHTFVASYSGDSNFAASTSPPFPITITQANTTTSLPQVSSGAGQNATVTVFVSAQAPGSGSPQGTVIFSDNKTTLGTSAIGAGGAASIAASFASGSHSISASYGGDTNFHGSQSAALAFSPGTTGGSTATVTFSFSEGAGGLMFSANVTGTAAMPTGTVQFMDVTANKLLGTATLANGSTSAAVNPAPAGHAVEAMYSGDTTYSGANSSANLLIVAASGFSSSFAAFAPDEFASVYGSGLTGAPLTPSQTGPATTLGGVSATITDQSGNTHASSILYVSPTQVNFVIPSDVPAGSGTLSVNSNSIPTTGPPLARIGLTIGSVSPSLAPVAQALPVHADGSQGALAVTANFNTTTQTWVPVAIAYGANSTDTLYLLLYGSGFRHAKGATTCLANGQALSVQYSGAQGSFQGLDQINAIVPPALRAAGAVQLTCSVDGHASNAMSLLFQ